MIKILKGKQELKFNSFTFPGGELSVKLNSNDYNFFSKVTDITIVARLQNTNDIFQLALIKDALEKLDKNPINLFMPYIPYARQDRVCDNGESFSLKVFCNYLNSLNFKTVTVCDPHSDVSPALINNVEVISQFNIINKDLNFTNRAKNCILISPDSGANKKTAAIAKYFEHDNFVRCDKARNLSTGEIKETIVYCDNFKGRDVCIVDDLCEKGGTFIALAKILKQKNAGQVILFVSHGLFSGDLNLLYQNGIDEIYTTNSYRTDLTKTDKFHILDLEERFIND